MKDLKVIFFLVAFIVPAFGGATTPDEPSEDAATEATFARHSKDCCYRQLVDQSAAERSPQDTLNIVNSDTSDPDKKAPSEGSSKAVRDE